MNLPSEFQEFVAAAVPAPSHDPLDALLGDRLLLPERDGADAYGRASHVLLGCPQDEGVARNHGRTGAAGAPAAIRQALYRLKLPMMQCTGEGAAGRTRAAGLTQTQGGTEMGWATGENSLTGEQNRDGARFQATNGHAAANRQIRLLDAGDVPHGSMERMHDSLRAAVGRALADGKTVIVLGGGNDISLPDCRAMAEALGPVAAVNVDAHLDMRRAPQVHSGTPYRNLLEGGWLEPQWFHEAGIQPWANSPAYLEDARAMGVAVHPLESILEQGAASLWGALFEKLEERPVFVGLDMDSVRACDAPGVSASSPVGLSGRDLLALARRAHHGGRTRVFEISETNPLQDVDGRTVRLAALAAYVFLFGA